MKRASLVVIMSVFLLALVPTVAVLADDATEIGLIGLEWDHEPLNVNIVIKGSLTNDLENDYEEMIIGVLGSWTTALQDASLNYDNYMFSFDSESEADIRIVIHPGRYSGVLGLTKPSDSNRDGYFDSVWIKMKVDSRLGPEDCRNVLRHEMGHALGLGHTDENAEDLMNPYYNPATEDDVLPSVLDIEALLSIYYDDGFGGDNIDPDDIPTTFIFP